MSSAAANENGHSLEATYQCIVAYDGTAFSGFQRQAPGVRSVQGEIEKALRAVGWTGRALHAAGRTDAGVHAGGQVISFALQWGHAPSALAAALNARLARDVAVRRVQIAPEGFHARYSAQSRCYRYQLLVDERRDPLKERFAWRLEKWPDIASLRRMADRVRGEHDFGAFGRPPKRGGTTVRRVLKAQWLEQDDGLLFEIQANAFLYHMVRRLVAAMVAVGLGQRSLEAFDAALSDPTRAWRGRLAPAHGLCLWSVSYPERDSAGGPAGDNEGV